MPRRASRWSYRAGEKGRNRVVAFEHRSGALYLEFRDEGRKRCLALPHRDKARAKQDADGMAAEFAKPKQVREPDELTIGELFDNYVQEVTPGKGEEKRSHDRRAVRLWLDAIPASRRAVSLCEADAKHFIAERKARGDLRPGKGGLHRNAMVRPRSWRSDIGFLKAALRWAVAKGIITRHPPVLAFRDRTRVEVRRPIVTDDEYQRLKEAAAWVSPGCLCMLVVAHETGHRIGAIRQLRWTDIDWAGETVRWRPEVDKTGWDHTTPLSAGALEALRAFREVSGVIGDMWVFAAPKTLAGSMSEHFVRDLWLRMEGKAQLARVERRGWHALRRKFASDLKHQPLVDVASLGGWKDTTTILRSYQQPDQATMRDALLSRRGPIAGATAEGTADTPTTPPKTPLPRIA